PSAGVERPAGPGYPGGRSPPPPLPGPATRPMSRFGPDPRAFFDAVYQDVPPWDVGGPQPALEALLDEFPPAGPALDLGCGSGDQAIALARRGLEVVGVDFGEAAGEQARAKAAALPPELAGRLEFRVADA